MEVHLPYSRTSRLPNSLVHLVRVQSTHSELQQHNQPRVAIYSHLVIRQGQLCQITSTEAMRLRVIHSPLVVFRSRYQQAPASALDLDLQTARQPTAHFNSASKPPRNLNPLIRPSTSILPRLKRSRRLLSLRFRPLSSVLALQRSKTPPNLKHRSHLSPSELQRSRTTLSLKHRSHPSPLALQRSKTTLNLSHPSHPSHLDPQQRRRSLQLAPLCLVKARPRLQVLA